MENNIEIFIDSLRKWNRTINLVSSDSLNVIYERHIIDSKQLLKYLNKDDKVLDVGSGAGFPGMILSILGINDVVLVESDSRKCSFLRAMQKYSSGNIEIINDRIENLDNIDCDVITVRGFANIKKIFEYTEKLKTKNYLLLKGKTVTQEIEEAKKEWLFKYKLHDSITGNGGKVVEIFEVNRKSWKLK